YRCTANGVDYPSVAESSTLVQGKAGAVNGGIAPGNLRIFASFDYALNANMLLGVRAGVKLLGYPGGYAGFNVPILAEARFTYLIGKDAILKAVAPYIGLGVGVSQYDVTVSVPVTETGKTPRNVDAWALGGPVYIAPSVGVRLRLGTPRAALNLGVRPVLAFGNLFTFAIEPEAALQFGF
ncbi:MAG TPA: hypothetical protein VF316_09930, partial [Polyangiaceae bacterium]